ncbi:MAG: hypothetical protein V1921_07225 [Candidatus Altiarchaeota archaeon]
MTGYRALELIEPAVKKTKDLLLKDFQIRFWLRMGLVVFLMTSLDSGLNVSRSLSSEELDARFSGLAFPLIILFVVTIICVALIFGIVSSIASFVFLESVMSGRVSIREGFKKHFRRGLSLFAFRLLIGIAVVVVVVLLAIPVILLSSHGLGTGFLILLAYLVPAFGVFIAVITVAALVDSFTTDFVIVFMLEKGDGIIASWKRLTAVIRAERMQFLVYVIVKLVLKIVAGILSLIVSLIILLAAAIILGVPLLVIGMLLYKFSGFNIMALKAAGLIILPVILLGVIIALAIIWLLAYAIIVVTLPLPVFFRYYSLMFIEKSARQKNEGKPKTEQKGRDYYVD